MDNREAIDMMKRVSAEIKELRARIAALEPRAQAYDDISTLLRVAVPRPSQGYGEDIAWQLDKRIRELEAEQAIATVKAGLEGEPA